MIAVNPGRRSGRLLIRADDPSLTAYAGLAISGELCRRLRLVELVDAELAAVDRVAPVKRRRRGLSPGELTVAIAEAQLAGAECFDDIEVLRADRALALWRAVAEFPSAPTARQLAYRFKPTHIRAIERAAARCGNELDRRLGRDPSEEATFDLDATESVVFGRRKQGAGRSRQGQLAYNSYVVTWAERGRALTSELKGGNQARIKATQSLTMLGRAERLLPAQHGQLTVRGDSGFYSVELMMGCRKRRDALHTVSDAHLADVGKASRDPRGCLEGRDPDARRAGRRAHLHPGGVEARAATADRPPRPGHRRGAACGQPEGQAAQDDPA